ncbi:MAG TPA: hypothetical protein VHI93_08315 [Candidatus Thermoplasmatota archaeon]|nr:hypothetical protein [Candidatus Thermoplasmatota archaeon]
MNATLETHRRKSARKGAAKKDARVAKRAAGAAKKSAKRARRRAVPAPTPLGTGAAAGRQEREAMAQVVLAAVPGRAYVAQGDIFEAARQGTSRSLFPGATHRMWAERVLQDLAASGVLEQDGSRPPRWRRARVAPPVLP